MKVPTELESLCYFRRFPRNYGYCAVNPLFSDVSARQGFFPGSAVALEWEYPCELSSVAHDEPLECVHARRTAFGDGHARIDQDASTPDRSLLFQSPHQSMNSYGNVSIHWKPTGVLELPAFCIQSALVDDFRVKNGFDPHYLEMLQAALTLAPARFDVFGFVTTDGMIVGAAEFTGKRTGHTYGVHVFVVGGSRELCAGDELWSWQTRNVGATRLEAQLHVATIQQIPGHSVPALERPTA